MENLQAETEELSFDKTPHTLSGIPLVDIDQEGIRWIEVPNLIHPFTCLVAGPTASGKTTFVKQLIEDKDDRIYLAPQRVVWCYSQWQALYENIEGIEFHSGLPELDSFHPNIRNLLIIDDLMDKTDSTITELFTKGSHHRNISVIYIVQNLFHQGKEHRTISLNSHYMILFKNPRDSSQIRHLARQIFPADPKYLEEVYYDAVAPPYGYLFIDLKQDTHENLRLRTNILKPVQYIYTPKNL